MLGTGLIRAGRPALVFRVAAGFTLFFAVTVQYFLFAYPDWMYSYFLSAAQLPPSWVSLPFLVAVAGAGAAGAAITGSLLRRDKTGLAWLNVAFGLGMWLLIWAGTWDAYFHIGTYASYHAGTAVPLAAAKAFQVPLNIAGALQGTVGLACAVFLLRASQRARALRRVTPDAGLVDWRQALGTELAGGGCALPPVIEGDEIKGTAPIDGAPLPPVQLTRLSHVDELLTRARAAQRAWAKVELAERARLLTRAGRRLLASSEELARLLEQENGKPLAESYLAELVPTADLFGYWTSAGKVALQPDPVAIDPVTFPGKRAVVEHLPRGVVLLISPWNFPVGLPLRTIVPALLAGNAVVFKPSEHAARCGARLAALLSEVLPADLLQVAQGGGELAQQLIASGVDHVSFTGSVQTGRLVAASAAKTLTPVSLELGGKDAAIVLADADLERAAAGVLWGALANAGQNCAAVERCYVVESVASKFVAILKEQLARLRTGPGGEGAVDIGPLTTPAQRRLVESHLVQARENGAQISGGELGEGLHLSPALLLDAADELAIVRDETFGPVLPVVRVADEEEAIRRANASAFGLTASVWSRNLHHAEGVARRLQAGVVTVNNHAFSGGIPQAPWGGVQGSGYGVTGGPLSLHALTRPRLVLVDASRAAKELWWYPYDVALLRIGRGLTRLRSGAPGKLGALREVVSGFLARQKS